VEGMDNLYCGCGGTPMQRGRCAPPCSRPESISIPRNTNIGQIFGATSLKGGGYCVTHGGGTFSRDSFSRDSFSRDSKL